ncbi:MAG: CDP-alcohol phosphatidyltransferase family protein [Candidatus Methanomethylophilaceae archaeon]|nr:CDP-alcohol phosphatidyltransferase family protein [Candidatus Methanomethylophilaceae archaeon]
MVLDNMRSQVDFAISPVARIFKNVNPNTISWIGLIIALASGVVFAFCYDYHILLLIGAFLVILSGYFDSLDGKVAKMFNKCTKKGDYLDHVFDRYADVFIIGGIAICGWCNIYLGLLAIIGTLLTSYMGTQAQAVGAPRLYAGLLGRADRLVLSTLFALLQYIFLFVANGDYATFTVTIAEKVFEISWLDIMLLWFAVVGNITAIQRAIVTWNNMDKMEKE